MRALINVFNEHFDGLSFIIDWNIVSSFRFTLFHEWFMIQKRQEREREIKREETL